MKRVAPILAILLVAAMRIAAQAPLPDPAHMRVEYEDERVRVIRITLEPGEKTETIALNERINVCATDGKVRANINGQDLGVFEVKAGSVRHEPGSLFWIENVGTREFQTIITEFKAPIAKSFAPGNQSEKPQQVASTEEPTKPTSRPPDQNPVPPTVARPIVQGTPEPAVQQPQVPAAQTSAPAQSQTPPPQTQTSQARRMDQPPTSIEPTALNVDGAKIAFLNGTELAYIERGQGSPVVLVHDTLGDYRSWAPQLSALSKNYRVIAYSQRYHYPNHSTGKERDYTYDLNAKDLTDFLRGLNVGPVRLIGFGYGASLAGMVAAEHPELVKALVVTEPAYEQLLDTTMAQRARYAREDFYGMIRKPLTKDKLEKGIEMYVDWLGYQTWAGLSTEEQFRRKQNGNALHAQTFDAAPPNFTCATAKKIAAPTLILSGQKRSANSAEIAGVLSGCIPQAERATVPNSGPAVYADNPADANKLLLDFLAKH